MRPFYLLTLITIALQCHVASPPGELPAIELHTAISQPELEIVIKYGNEAIARAEKSINCALADGLLLGQVTGAAAGINRQVIVNQQVGAGPSFSQNKANNFSYNLCLVDNEILVLTSGLNQLPAIALVYRAERRQLIEDAARQLRLFHNGLSGKKRGKIDQQTDFTLLDETVSLHWGPLDEALLSIAETMAEEQEVSAFVAGFSGSVAEQLAKKISRQVVITDRATWQESNALPALPPQAAILRSKFEQPALNLVISENQASLYLGDVNQPENQAMTLTVKNGALRSRLVSFYSEIATQAERGQSSSPEEETIVINELLWMGSEHSQKGHLNSDEYLELYNYGPTDIPVGGYELQCGRDSFDWQLELPAGAIIEANQYRVIGRKRVDGLLSGSQVFWHSKFQLANGTTYCRLLNGYGQVIDQAGDGLTPFNRFENGLAHSTGFNGLLGRTYQRRSMERIYNGNIPRPGPEIENWRSNRSLLPAESGFAHTFASLGFRNSEEPLSTLAGSLVISEVNEKTYDDDRDQFIEISNLSTEDFNLNSLVLEQNLNTESQLFVLPALKLKAETSLIISRLPAEHSVLSMTNLVLPGLRVNNRRFYLFHQQGLLSQTESFAQCQFQYKTGVAQSLERIKEQKGCQAWRPAQLPGSYIASSAKSRNLMNPYEVVPFALNELETVITEIIPLTALFSPGQSRWQITGKNLHMIDCYSEIRFANLAGTHCTYADTGLLQVTFHNLAPQSAYLQIDRYGSTLFTIQSGLLINKLQHSSVYGASMEYISLVNTSDQAIDLAGLRIELMNSTGRTSQKQLELKKSWLQPAGIGLVASREWAAANPVNVIATYSTSGISLVSKGAAIIQISGIETDRLGYNDSTGAAGQPAPAFSKTQLLQRKQLTGNKWQNTRDNQSDFVLQQQETGF